MSNTHHLSIRCQRWKIRATFKEKSLVIWFFTCMLGIYAQHKYRNHDTEKKWTIIQCGIKLKMCPAKKKNCSHANKITQTHISPPSASQITEPAVFTFVFYLYVCTDVCYWRGGVPINLRSLYLHLKSTSFCLPAMACKIRELSNNVRQEGNLENVAELKKQKKNFTSQLKTDILICFRNFVRCGSFGLASVRTYITWVQ